MNFKEFKDYIVKSITEKVDEEIRVHIDRVTKNNGLQLDSLVIQNPKRNISPNIYLNPYYGQYLDGRSIDDIVEDIYDTYVTHMPDKDFDISIIESFDYAREQVIMKLVNYKENKDLLARIPHVPYLDMAIIFQIVLELEKNNTGTITITNSLFKRWGIELEQLYEIAKTNTPRLFPYTFDNISEYLPEYVPNTEYRKESNSVPMYILTNNKKMNGATTLLYEGLLQQIAEEYNCDFILIPSSIHEVILIPAKNSDEEIIDYLNHMVQEVNCCELSADEVLSSHTYYFSRKTACLQ